MENMLQTQTPPAFEQPYVPPPATPPPTPVAMAAPAVAYEQGGEINTSLKDANWVGILVSSLIVAAMFAIMYHTAQKIKFYKRNFNSLQSQLTEAKAEIDNVKRDIDNQKMLVESNNNNQYSMGW